MFTLMRQLKSSKRVITFGRCWLMRVSLSLKSRSPHCCIRRRKRLARKRLEWWLLEEGEESKACDSISVIILWASSSFFSSSMLHSLPRSRDILQFGENGKGLRMFKWKFSLPGYIEKTARHRLKSHYGSHCSFQFSLFQRKKLNCP